MMIERRDALVAAALAVLSLVVVVVDVGGPLRAVPTALFVLVVPGLLLSAAMGPMSGSARALVAILGSVSIATLLSLLLLVAGIWSGPLAQAVLSLGVLAVVLRALTPPRTSGDADPVATDPSGAEPVTEPIPTTTSRSESAGRPEPPSGLRLRGGRT